MQVMPKYAPSMVRKILTIAFISLAFGCALLSSSATGRVNASNPFMDSMNLKMASSILDAATEAHASFLGSALSQLANATAFAKGVPGYTQSVRDAFASDGSIKPSVPSYYSKEDLMSMPEDSLIPRFGSSQDEHTPQDDSKCFTIAKTSVPMPCVAIFGEHYRASLRSVEGNDLSCANEVYAQPLAIAIPTIAGILGTLNRPNFMDSVVRFLCLTVYPPCPSWNPEGFEVDPAPTGIPLPPCNSHCTDVANELKLLTDADNALGKKAADILITLNVLPLIHFGTCPESLFPNGDDLGRVELGGNDFRYVCNGPTRFRHNPDPEYHVGRCETYTGSTCKGMFGKVYMAPGLEQYMVEYALRVLPSLIRVAPVANECHLRLNEVMCGQIYWPCEEHDVQMGVTDTVVKLPLPQLPSRAVCERYMVDCFSFREWAMYVLTPAEAKALDIKCDTQPSGIAQTFDCKGAPVPGSGQPMFPVEGTNYGPLFGNLFVKSHSFTHESMSNAENVPLTPTITCPAPLIVPDEENTNKRMFSGSCATPCPSMLFTEDEYDRSRVMFLVLSIICFIPVSFILLTWMCFASKRESSYFVAIVVMCFFISLALFVGAVVFASRASDRGSYAGALCANNSQEISVQLGGSSAHGVVCIAQAVVLLYVILALCGWWCVSSVDLFIKTVLGVSFPPGSHGRNVIRLAYNLVGWMAPVILVIVAVISDTLGASDVGMSYCFVHSRNSVMMPWYICYYPLIGFLSVGGLALIATLIAMCRAARKTARQVADHQRAVMLFGAVAARHRGDNIPIRVRSFEEVAALEKAAAQACEEGARAHGLYESSSRRRRTIFPGRKSEGDTTTTMTTTTTTSDSAGTTSDSLDDTTGGSASEMDNAMARASAARPVATHPTANRSTGSNAPFINLIPAVGPDAPPNARATNAAAAAAAAAAVAGHGPISNGDNSTTDDDVTSSATDGDGPLPPPPAPLDPVPPSGVSAVSGLSMMSSQGDDLSDGGGGVEMQTLQNGYGHPGNDPSGSRSNPPSGPNSEGDNVDPAAAEGNTEEDREAKRARRAERRARKHAERRAQRERAYEAAIERNMAARRPLPAYLQDLTSKMFARPLPKPMPLPPPPPPGRQYSAMLAFVFIFFIVFASIIAFRAYAHYTEDGWVAAAETMVICLLVVSAQTGTECNTIPGSRPNVHFWLFMQVMLIMAGFFAFITFGLSADVYQLWAARCGRWLRIGRCREWGADTPEGRRHAYERPGPPLCVPACCRNAKADGSTTGTGSRRSGGSSRLDSRASARSGGMQPDSMSKTTEVPDATASTGCCGWLCGRRGLCGVKGPCADCGLCVPQRDELADVGGNYVPPHMRGVPVAFFKTALPSFADSVNDNTEDDTEADNGLVPSAPAPVISIAGLPPRRGAGAGALGRGAAASKGAPLVTSKAATSRAVRELVKKRALERAQWVYNTALTAMAAAARAAEARKKKSIMKRRVRLANGKPEKQSRRMAAGKSVTFNLAANTYLEDGRFSGIRDAPGYIGDEGPDSALVGLSEDPDKNVNDHAAALRRAQAVLINVQETYDDDYEDEDEDEDDDDTADTADDAAADAAAELAAQKAIAMRRAKIDSGGPRLNALPAHLMRDDDDYDDNVAYAGDRDTSSAPDTTTDDETDDLSGPDTTAPGTQMSMPSPSPPNTGGDSTNELHNAIGGGAMDHTSSWVADE